MKELAIIGPTASGKSALAIALARKHDAYILSIDSLSIYKEIDIVSAKPSPEELASVRHFGIDILYPDEYFNVARFLELYQEAKEQARRDAKHLILVGGSSFYLKMLLHGISPMPAVSEEIREQARSLTARGEGYAFLERIDPAFAAKIPPTDRYRIQRALEIHFATGLAPSRYFVLHPPSKIASMPIFEIAVDRAKLRQRIKERTQKMLAMGLIDEVAYLERRYTRAPHPMKAIGIKETLAFLDGKIKTEEELCEAITTHTAQLAKRQMTFNKTQFSQKIAMDLGRLQERIEKELAD